MALYLLIKQHQKTGLKYLCKHEASCFSDCESYKGSGTYWKRHLSRYGNDIKTTCLYVTENKEEFRKIALDYSLKFDVVNSNDWANLCNEEGQGGNTIIDKEKFSEIMVQSWNSLSSEDREKRLTILRQNNKITQPLATAAAKQKLTGIPKTEEHKRNMRGKRPQVNQTGSKNNNAKKIKTPYGIFGSIRDAEKILANKELSYMSIWKKVQKGEDWSYCND